MPPKSKRPTSYITFITVTYRSVLLSILGVIVVVAIVTWFAFPQFRQQAMDSAENLLEKLSTGAGAGSGNEPKTFGQQQAHFTNIDGTVRVKRNNASSWTNADYNLPLEKGDVIQTGPEGIAKVVFADGSSYTIKPDSLIVVEDNSTNAAQQTQVAVQVTTGTVDLATATYSSGSRSQVIVAGARATIGPESAAQVRNDPRSHDHEIFLRKGSGEVSRNGESVQMAASEKVSFTDDSARMVKEKTVSPPTLISPANMMPVVSSEIEFSWTPMDNVKAYQIQISQNPYFSQLLLDKTVPSAETVVSGLSEGSYYWSVRSVDGNGKVSVESERDKFSIVPKGKDAGLMMQLEPLVSHGHVIEVRGRTDPSARVVVNGEEVPIISGDGSFHYYTPPLPRGENTITITAQNTRGGINTQRKSVKIE